MRIIICSIIGIILGVIIAIAIHLNLDVLGITSIRIIDIYNLYFASIEIFLSIGIIIAVFTLFRK